MTAPQARARLATASSGAEPLLRLAELTQFIPVLPLPLEAGNLYGAIRAMLSAKGELIAANDLWIAAHARAMKRAMNLILVTNNEREFRRNPDLRACPAKVIGIRSRVENWTKSPD